MPIAPELKVVRPIGRVTRSPTVVESVVIDQSVHYSLLGVDLHYLDTGDGIEVIVIEAKRSQTILAGSLSRDGQIRVGRSGVGSKPESADSGHRVVQTDGRGDGRHST